MKPQGYIELRCFCGKRLGGWEVTPDIDQATLTTLPTLIKCRDCKQVVRFVMVCGEERKAYVRDPVRSTRNFLQRIHEH